MCADVLTKLKSDTGPFYKQSDTDLCADTFDTLGSIRYMLEQSQEERKRRKPKLQRIAKLTEHRAQRMHVVKHFHRPRKSLIELGNNSGVDLVNFSCDVSVKPNVAHSFFVQV